MNLQSWGFSPSANQRTTEQREDAILAIVIGTSLLISSVIAIWIIVSTIVSPPRYTIEPMPTARWDFTRG